MILLTLEKVQLEVTKKQLRSEELRERSVFHVQSRTYMYYQCSSQLYIQRSSVVKTKVKKYWDEIDYRYMTDESDGELDGKTIKDTHRPSWRSSGECKA